MIPALLALVYALAFVDRALVAVAGGPIKAEFGLGDAQFGLLGGTAFALLFCLCSLPLGWLADRTDRRRLIALGIVVWSAATAACGLAQGFDSFAVARLGVGLGEACLVPAGISLIRAGVPAERRGRAVALFLMGATSGNALALLGGGYLLEVTSWRPLFLGAAALGLPLAGLILTLREPPREPSPGFGAALRHLAVHGRAYGLLTAATACSIALAQAQAVWIPQFFARSFTLPPGRAAMLAGLLFVLSAPPGQWLGGWAIDRLKRHSVAAPNHLVLAACALLGLAPATLFCTADNLAVAATAYWLFNLIVFSATPAGLSGWQALTPAGLQGSVTAILTSVATLAGVGLGPLAVGALAERWTLGPALLSLLLTTGLAGAALALVGRASFAEAIGRLVGTAD